MDGMIYYEGYVVMEGGVKGEDGMSKYELLCEEEYVDIMESVGKENEYVEERDGNKFMGKMGGEGMYDLVVGIDLDGL